MRIRSAVAVVTALVALAAGAVAADPLREPWAGFAPGSWVHQRTVTRTGVAKAPETVTEARTTLVKAVKGAVTLKSEFRIGTGAWQAQEITMDASAQEPAQTAKTEPMGEEKLTVDGRELVCRKQRTALDGTTTVSWTHADYGVVRSESRTGDASTRVSLEKLAVKTKAGAEEVECRQVVTTTTTTVGTSTTTMWVSTAVPGGVVRSETLSSHGGMRLAMVTETVQFVAKR